MDYSALDDAALLTLIAGAYGKPSADPALNSAIGVLYDRYGRLVYTIAIHVVGDGETAEEITQDVFVRACESARSYRPEMAKVSSWLISITRHRSIDELRRRGSRPEKERVDWPDDIGQETTEGLPTLSGPEGDLELTQEQRGLQQIIATLPADQREVLGLAYFMGLSHSEIAEKIGQPLGTVKSRIRLAMHKLRESLVEQGYLDQG